MEFYVKFSFWVHILGLVMAICTLINGEFPKKKEESLGYWCAKAILGVGFVAWTAILIWGGK